MYQPYVDENEYFNTFHGDVLKEENADKYLKKASRDIDVLTYNRILKKGFNELTLFQQVIIKEVCCEHASFLFENESMLDTYLSNYSINGVNMSFGNSWNLQVYDGVAMDKSLYERLSITGLCSRSFYYG